MVCRIHSRFAPQRTFRAIRCKDVRVREAYFLQHRQRRTASFASRADSSRGIVDDEVPAAVLCRIVRDMAPKRFPAASFSRVNVAGFAFRPTEDEREEGTESAGRLGARTKRC